MSTHGGPDYPEFPSVERSSSFTNASNKRPRQRALEKFGSAKERAPYLKLGIGRRLVGSALENLVEPLRWRVGLDFIPNSGIVYVPGQEIAKRANYGLGQDGTPRKAPEQIIQRLSQEIYDGASHEFEPIALPLVGVDVKKWGNAAQLFITVGDIRDKEADTPRVLSERIKAKQRITPEHQLPASFLSGEMQHTVPVGVFELEERPFALAAISSLDIRGLDITFEGVGPVHSPLPKI